MHAPMYCFVVCITFACLFLLAQNFCAEIICSFIAIHTHIFHSMPKRGYGWTKRGTKASRRNERRRQRSSRYYAVAVGRRPGIFATWDDAHAQVHRFSGAQHKSFVFLHDAFVYMYKNMLYPPAQRELFPHVLDTPRPSEIYYDAYLQYWRMRERDEEVQGQNQDG